MNTVRKLSDGAPFLARIPSEIRIGKTTETITQGESGLVQMYDGKTPDEMTETSEPPVPCYLRMGTVVDEDRWVYVQKFPNWNEIVGFEC